MTMSSFKYIQSSCVAVEALTYADRQKARSRSIVQTKPARDFLETKRDLVDGGLRNERLAPSLSLSLSLMQHQAAANWMHYSLPAFGDPP